MDIHIFTLCNRCGGQVSTTIKKDYSGNYLPFHDCLIRAVRSKEFHI